MHTSLSNLLAIHALSAVALATPALTDDRSGAFGTLGQDAKLTIYLWDNVDCTPSLDYRTVNLSWGSMQSITGASKWFSLSRHLEATENLDWSGFAPDPAGANIAPAEHVPPGCEYYLKTTNEYPPGERLADSCTPIGMVANVSDPSAERAKCTDRHLSLVRKRVGY